MPSCSALPGHRAALHTRQFCTGPLQCRPPVAIGGMAAFSTIWWLAYAITVSGERGVRLYCFPAEPPPAAARARAPRPPHPTPPHPHPTPSHTHTLRGSGAPGCPPAALHAPLARPAVYNNAVPNGTPEGHYRSTVIGLSWACFACELAIFALAAHLYRQVRVGAGVCVCGGGGGGVCVSVCVSLCVGVWGVVHTHVRVG